MLRYHGIEDISWCRIGAILFADQVCTSGYFIFICCHLLDIFDAKRWRIEKMCAMNVELYFEHVPCIGEQLQACLLAQVWIFK